MYFVALKMLLFDKTKYIGLIFAIAIATFLMSQQATVFIGVVERAASQIIDVREADIWVMSPNVQHFEELKRLRDIDLYRVRSVPGVQWAIPFFKGFGLLHSFGNVVHEIFLYGVDDVVLPSQPRMVVGKWQNLKEPNSIILDRAGWQLIWGKQPYQLGTLVQINDQRMKIVGIAEPSASFFAFPLVYTRYSEAVKLSPQGYHNLAYILVKTAPEFKPEDVTKKITKQTGLQALTSHQFEWRSMDYVLLNTPIPINFGLTILLGFLIGAVIAGQTFYIFVLENLQQFGLLKAIGVTNTQIITMVMLQAAWIGFIGFGIGIGACSVFLEITARTIIDFRGIFVPWQIILMTAISILFVMFLASITGVRKVVALDPVIVFKGQ